MKSSSDLAAKLSVKVLISCAFLQATWCYAYAAFMFKNCEKKILKQNQIQKYKSEKQKKKIKKSEKKQNSKYKKIKN